MYCVWICLDQWNQGLLLVRGVTLLGPIIPKSKLHLVKLCKCPAPLPAGFEISIFKLK